MTARPDHGRQIAAARAILRLTLDDLAKLSGLHKQSIVYNERKGRFPRHAHAAKRMGEALEPLGVSFETRKDGYAVVFKDTPPV